MCICWRNRTQIIKEMLWHSLELLLKGLVVAVPWLSYVINV